MTVESYLVTLKGPRRTFYSVSNWFPDGKISVTCLDIERSEHFIFTIDSDVIGKQKTESGGENFEKHLKECFKDGSHNYEIVPDDGNFITWKAIGERGFKLTLGQFPLASCDFEKAVSEMFSSASREMKELRLKNKERTEELAKVKTLIHHYEEQFEKAIEEKKNLEEELFSQFLPILNSKKRKIRELLEQEKSNDGEQSRDHAAPHAMSDSDGEDELESTSLMEQNKSVDSQNFLDLSSV